MEPIESFLTIFVIVVGTILTVSWVLFPFLLLSKLGESNRRLKAIEDHLATLTGKRDNARRRDDIA